MLDISRLIIFQADEEKTQTTWLDIEFPINYLNVGNEIVLAVE